MTVCLSVRGASSALTQPLRESGSLLWSSRGPPKAERGRGLACGVGAGRVSSLPATPFPACPRWGSPGFPPWGPRRRDRPWMRPLDRVPSPQAPVSALPGSGPVAGGSLTPFPSPHPSPREGACVQPRPHPAHSLFFKLVCDGTRSRPLRAPSGTQAAATAPGNRGGRESRVREKLSQCAEWRE